MLLLLLLPLPELPSHIYRSNPFSDDVSAEIVIINAEARLHSNAIYSVPFTHENEIAVKRRRRRRNCAKIERSLPTKCHLHSLSLSLFCIYALRHTCFVKDENGMRL